MFDKTEWFTENLISGVKRGVFAVEQAAMYVANMFPKGLLTEAQVEQIATEAVYIPPPVPEPYVPPIEESLIDPLTGQPIVSPLIDPLTGQPIVPLEEPPIEEPLP